MINKPHPFKGLNIRIPIVIPFNGTGFINQRSGLGTSLDWVTLGRVVPDRLAHISWKVVKIEGFSVQHVLYV